MRDFGRDIYSSKPRKNTIHFFINIAIVINFNS